MTAKIISTVLKTKVLTIGCCWLRSSSYMGDYLTNTVLGITNQHEDIAHIRELTSQSYSVQCKSNGNLNGDSNH